MTREELIRRLREVARRHAWEAAAVALFGFGLVLGARPVLAGAGEFLGTLAPGMPAQASDQPSRAGEGVARLPMFDFASASPYAPQVLFPVTGHLLPLWMQLRGAMDIPPPPGPAHPAIAICMDDLGEDLAGTDRAMELPGAVALSFLPYADSTPFLAEEAEKKGHVVLAHVPMEALSGTDPGPMSLKAGGKEIAARLGWNLARVPGLSGINNHEGSRFSEDAASLTPVAQILAARHLFFFDSRTVGDSRVTEVARRFGVMSAGRDIFLDDDVSEAGVRAQLDALVAVARHDGIAIAIGHPHEVTLRVLAEWLKTDHGVELISLPEALRRKSENVAVAAR